MPNLVFKLNSVPDDEADDVRQLLDEAEINFYETDSGRWGLGYAAIWTKDKDSLDTAKALIKEYQLSRYNRVMEEHKAIEESGEKISRLSFFLTSPVRFSILILFAALLAYFTVIPFFY
ncbi:MAG: hypothetical protein COA86_16295 [Kangiella sp.]|nr:MAG: hypothetical protein COA86_16295 [Kangiella sp.]